MSLEFSTTDELITELTNRSTFVGVIVASTAEQKNPNQKHDNFNCFTTMDGDGTIQILESLLQAMKFVRGHNSDNV